MSLKSFFKSKKHYAIGILIICGFLCFTSSLRAQKLDLEINIAEEFNQKKVLIRGKLLEPEKFGDTRNWLFVKSYAEATDLAARVQNLKLYDAEGRELPVRKLSSGEYQAGNAAQSFSYEIQLEVPIWTSSSAHISWLGETDGLLMFGDLLPEFDSSKPVSADIKFNMPDGWKIYGNGTANVENKISVADVSKTIFAAGRNWRERKVSVENTEINFTTNGNWQFADEEVARMASEIFAEYRKIFGESPTQKVQIFLLPFPQKNIQTDRWQAETRGATVTIVSGAIAEKRQAIQRLHEQLRHEIFHLWLPNAVNLAGDYSWFYEGFAVYQALKTGVQLNQIRFEDFLNTLAAAFELARNQKKSLLEISNRRWAGNAAGGIYGKGMIVAFLCDAELLVGSGGKKSLTDVFRQIYQKYQAPSQSPNANQAILSILKSRAELGSIVRDYVEGEKPLEWQETLKKFGIEVVSNEGATKLRVVSNPGGRQRDLLDKLGYNQWRKLRREN